MKKTFYILSIILIFTALVSIVILESPLILFQIDSNNKWGRVFPCFQLLRSNNKGIKSAPILVKNNDKDNDNFNDKGNEHRLQKEAVDYDGSVNATKVLNNEEKNESKNKLGLNKEDPNIKDKNPNDTIEQAEQKYQNFQKALWVFSDDEYRNSIQKKGDSYLFITKSVDFLDNVWDEYVQAQHKPEIALQYFLYCAEENSEKLPHYLKAYCLNKAEELIASNNQLKNQFEKQKEKISPEVRFASQNLND